MVRSISEPLAGADGIHQVKNLAALFAVKRSGMEIADQLRDGEFDAEEFIGKEFEDPNRLA
jgi:hypothetical protein